METDCIYREAAIAEIKRFIGYLDEDMIERLQVAIRRIHAADVRLVVRGKWLSYSDPIIPDLTCYCSKCGSTNERMANFCPNCGADMREVTP